MDLEEPSGRALHCLDGATYELPVPGLPGIHQKGNAAQAAVAVLRARETLPVSDAAIAKGVAAAAWPARMQRLNKGPLVDRAGADTSVWLDGGHNAHAAAAIAAMLGDWRADRPDTRVAVIFGTLNNRRDYLAGAAHRPDCRHRNSRREERGRRTKLARSRVLAYRSWHVLTWMRLWR